MADLYFYREILGMSNYLNTVTRRDKIEPNDSLVFNRASGATNQIAYNKFTEALPTGIESVVAGTNVTVDNTDPKNPIVSSTGGGGGSFANVIDATAGDYTLVPDSNNPVTVITMEGTVPIPSAVQLFINSGAFEVGAVFEVCNISDSFEVPVNLGLGVSADNVSAATVINAATSESGSARAKFVYQGSDVWIAYGDLNGGS